MKQNRDWKIKKTYIVGLTGGVGCGKSFVADVLCGYFPVYVLFTDEIAKQQMQPGKISYQAVVQEFGEEILTPSKEIDRSRLSQIIFTDEAAKKRLNQLTHPRVEQEVLDRIAKIKETGEYLAVLIETALLMEAGYQRFCDEVWYVFAPKNERIHRLSKFRGYSKERIEAMLHAQACEEDFLSCADRVITNRDNTTVSDIIAQAEKIFLEWSEEK